MSQKLAAGSSDSETRSLASPAESSAGVAPFGVIHQRQIRNALSARSLYAGLYVESHGAKLWKVAQDYLARGSTLKNFPEHIPTASLEYRTKPSLFWTSAFLPACLYAILERRAKHPKSLPVPNTAAQTFYHRLSELCRAVSNPLHSNASRTDTHDLGFLTLPLKLDFELTGDRRCLNSLKAAAGNLSSRFNPNVGAIRSWNVAESRTYNIVDLQRNFLVIIDSMANLDLLFWVGNHTGDQTLIEKATKHAHTVIRTLIRNTDFSTIHVANLDPLNGEVKHHFTHQGYRDTSCWSRGQAWAILGFAQTYMWTEDPTFLVVAMSLANYFVQRLSRLTIPNNYVPPWDFDAPIDPGADILRDTSAGVIAANGLLLLHQILQGQSPFLEVVQRIIEDTHRYSLSPDSARFEVDSGGECSVRDVYPAILMHSTANNNENALFRYSDCGYIVADYYYLELGNKLLRMGLA